MEPYAQDVDPGAPVSFAPMKMTGSRSSAWPTVRQRWLTAHSRCAVCGGRELLEVHHIRPFHLWPELELDSNNLLTLCEHPTRQCHLRWGHLGWWQAYNPQILADVLRIRGRPTSRDDSLFPQTASSDNPET